MPSKKPQYCAHLQDADDTGSPWASTADNWPQDDELREAKPPFIIWVRRSNQPVIWRRWVDGKWEEFTHTEALAIARLENKAKDKREAA